MRKFSVAILMAVLMAFVGLYGCESDSNPPETNPPEAEHGPGYYQVRESVDFSKKITGKTYYVSSSEGSDENDGLSVDRPIKTLARASEIVLEPGDGILLRRGDVWENERFYPKGSGTFENPVVIYSYGEGQERPVIKKAGIDMACITLEGNDGIIVAGLELAESYGGLLIQYQGDNSLGNDYLHIEDLYVHDMIDTFNSDPYEYNHTSFGIALRGNVDLNAPSRLMLTNFILRNTEFFNCEVGFWGVGKIGYMHVPAYDYGVVDNFLIENIKATACGKWGYCFHFMENGLMKNIDSYYTGLNGNNFGSCAYLLIAVKNSLVENIYIDGHYRNASQNYDGCGFDFEGLCENVTFRNSSIKNIDGPGMFVFNNGGGRDNIDILIENVKFENYGLNDAVRTTAEGAGILFEGNSNGKIRNCTFTNIRNIAKTPTFRELSAGASNNFIMENITEISNEPVWEYGFEGEKNTMGFARTDFIYQGAAKTVGSTVERLTARNGWLDAVFTAPEQYLMSPDNIRCELNEVNFLELTMRNMTAATKIKIEYGYEANSNIHSFEYEISPNDEDFKVYTIDLNEYMGENKRGDMKWFRIYLLDGQGAVRFDQIKLYK